MILLRIVILGKLELKGKSNHFLQTACLGMNSRNQEPANP